jgi:hypothetical protein
METRKSEFDLPINLYSNLVFFVRNRGENPTFEDAMEYGGFGRLPLWIHLRTLEQWGWIEYNRVTNSIRLTRPTENIYLVPRPIQEAQS